MSLKTQSERQYSVLERFYTPIVLEIEEMGASTLGFLLFFRGLRFFSLLCVQIGIPEGTISSSVMKKKEGQLCMGKRDVDWKLST